VKLSLSEKKTLRLALHLAIEWESTLADANTPDPIYGPPKADTLRTIRACARNIKRFKRLRDKLCS
jgi:hypothetical protein